MLHYINNAIIRTVSYIDLINGGELILAGLNNRFFEPRIKDLIFLSIKDADKKASNFLDPKEQLEAEQIARSFSGIRYYFDGGYPEAERKIMVVCPDFLEDRPFNVPLGALRITPHNEHCYPGHRDYLGAILALGIAREKIGDLVVGKDSCDVIIKSDIIEYVGLNLTKVGSTSVVVEEITLKEISGEEGAFKEIKGTVASLRLDAVSSIAFGMSRSKIAPYIKGENLRLNFKTVKDPAAPIKEGDIISASRIGRAKIVEVGGTSKKGRTYIKVHRYSSR